MKSTKHKRRGNLTRSHQMLTLIIIKAKNQGVNPWKPSPLGPRLGSLGNDCVYCLKDNATTVIR